MENQSYTEGSIWKGLAAGAIAGLIATYVMSQFQSGLKSLLADSEQSKGKKQDGGKSPAGGEKEPSTVKAAEAITEGLADHELTKSEKKVAGPIMHYAMGATSGAVYGIAAELQPAVTTGAGMPFGATVWLLADEVAVPAFGLSEPPWKTSLSVHAEALAAHCVYGVATDALRRLVRSAL